MRKYNSISARLLARKYKLRLRDIRSKTTRVTIKDVKTAIKRKKSKSKKGKGKFGDVTDLFDYTIRNNLIDSVDLEDYLNMKT